jgi:hypothetical protein
MRSVVVLTEVVDRGKAMVWLRKKGNTVADIGMILGSLPYEMDVEEHSLSSWVPYCEVRDIEKLQRLLDEKGMPPSSGEVGFKIEVRISVPAEERELVERKISDLKDIKSAREWYAGQPDDVRQKVDLIVRDHGTLVG